MRNTLIIIVLLLLGGLYKAFAQETASGLGDSPKLEVSGYIKNLQTLLFFNDAYPDVQQFELVDTFLQDNLSTGQKSE